MLHGQLKLMHGYSSRFGTLHTQDSKNPRSST
jgi:hypothetical protein